MSIDLSFGVVAFGLVIALCAVGYTRGESFGVVAFGLVIARGIGLLSELCSFGVVAFGLVIAHAALATNKGGVLA